MALIQAEIDLANISLGRIGAKQITLASCTANTRPEDVQVNLHYAHTRDSLLRSCNWNFAVKRLALVGTWATGVTYATTQYVWIDLSASTITATITHFTNYNGTVTGTTEVTTSAAHGFKTGMYITIAGTTNYNGSYYVTYVDATNFYITKTYVADDATGTLTYSSNLILFKCATANIAGIFTTDLAASKWTIAISRPSFGFAYQYDLPSDCLRFGATDIDDDDYDVEGKLFLSDEQEANIEYIYQVTDTTIWDTLFYEVMILKLAINLLHPLAGTSVTPLRQGLEQELREVMSKARVITKSETNTTGKFSWNNSRWG